MNMALPNESLTAYDELLELLTEKPSAQRIRHFRASAAIQDCIDDLLEKNRRGTLSPEELNELEEFERVEHLVRMLKARVRQKL
jgi:adenylate cyclase